MRVFGALNGYEPILVSTTVVNGQVIDQSVADPHGEVSIDRAAELLNRLGTVSRLFDNAKETVDSCANSGGDTIPRITYDKQYGFPNLITLEHVKPVSDESGLTSVDKFEVIP